MWFNLLQEEDGMDWNTVKFILIICGILFVIQIVCLIVLYIKGTIMYHRDRRAQRRVNQRKSGTDKESIADSPRPP